MPKIPVKVVTWDDVTNWTFKVAEKIKEQNYQADIIIAIARGGMVPARLLADYLGVLDVLSIKVEHWVTTAGATPEAKIKYPYTLDLSGKKVIIMDDIADTGDSFILAKKFVEENFRPEEIKTASMQVIKPTSKYIPDFFGDCVNEWAWFMYPWNYWEDMINLTKKIIDEIKRVPSVEELEKMFKESYGISTPPVSLDKILEEMKRRKNI